MEGKEPTWHVAHTYGGIDMTMKDSTMTLTPEQNEALKELKTRYPDHDEAFERFEEHLLDPWESAFVPLEDFSLKDMAFLLVSSKYVIEYTYGEGDWILYDDGRVFRMEDMNYEAERPVFFADDGKEWGYINCIVRHATPDEIEEEMYTRMWTELGREPEEFKEGDVVWHEDGLWFVKQASNREGVTLAKGVRVESDRRVALKSSLRMSTPVDWRWDVMVDQERRLGR